MRVFLICALGALLASCSSGDKKGAPPTPEAGYVVVQSQSVSLPVTLAGRTAAYEMSEVRPQVSGVIRARQFTEGTIVREGQTLYQIDPSLYQAAAEEARANVAAAEATRSAAATKAARYAPLAKIEAISQQDYTDAAAQARQAAAQVAVGRATLDTARVKPALYARARTYHRSYRAVAGHDGRAGHRQPDRPADDDPAARPDVRRYPAIER